ncbi:hypothetical protein ACJX0J_030541, partial [Zea mays]
RNKQGQRLTSTIRKMADSLCSLLALKSITTKILFLLLRMLIGSKQNVKIYAHILITGNKPI